MAKTSQKSRKPRSEINRDYYQRKKKELKDLKDQVKHYELRIAQLVGQVDLLAQQKLDLEEERRNFQRMINIGTGPNFQGGISKKNDPRVILDSTPEIGRFFNELQSDFG
ncbi:24483_t:CDS:2 [Cetraspora pellucida]|uniref:24483_t:CDS:1 n=1 Tax=Cetraspora pellucida TaxID=1433469 RepID=A0A9N9N4R3_9GLOM|nr:24483_t:CDS:2 [Cetraspora pellucida]